MALIPLGLGLAFFVMGCVMVRRTRGLRRTGASAYGVVVRLAAGGGQSNTVRPVVRWLTPDGRTVEAAPPIGKTWVGGAFRPGRTVVVRYDPQKPDRMAIDGYGAGAEWLFLVIGAALLVGTLTVLAFSVP